jgi:hypothetical protein
MTTRAADISIVTDNGDLPQAQAEPFDGLNAPTTNTTTQLVHQSLTVRDDEVRNFNPSLVKTLSDWSKIDWNSSSEDFWITDSQRKTIAAVDYTMTEYFKYVVGEMHPPYIRALHGATYAVTRRTIRKVGKAKFERALRKFEECAEDAKCCLAGEIGWFQERLWLPLYSRKYWLREDGCNYEREDWSSSRTSNRRDTEKEKEDLLRPHLL